MPGSRLHFIGGDTLLVEQSPDDVARMLWGRERGNDAADMGYAPVQTGGSIKFVNRATVTYVEDAPKPGVHGLA